MSATPPGADDGAPKRRLRRVRMLARPRAPLSPLVVDTLGLAHRFACGACAVTFGWMLLRGDPAWLMGAIAFGIAAGATLFQLNARLRAHQELVLRDRLALISSRLLSTRDELEIRGTPTPVLPALLLVVWFLAYAPAASSLSFQGNVIFMSFCPLLLLAWMRGARWLCRPILALSRDGLTIPALGCVSWHDVTQVSIARARVRSGPYLQSLVITLARGKDSRGSLSWWQRYVRGAELGKVAVPLRNTTEDPLLINNLAQTLLRAANPLAADAATRVLARFTREDAALIAAIRRATAPLLPITTAPSAPAALPAPTAPAATPELFSATAEQLTAMFEREVREQERQIHELDAAMHDLRNHPGRLPPRKQWTIVAVMLLLVAAVIFGLETRFVPAQRWDTLAFYVSLPPALALSAALIAWLWTRIAERSRIGAAVVLVLVPLSLSWVLFACALPDLYTRFAGQPFRIEQPVTVKVHGGRGCHNELHAPILDDRAMKPYVCVSDEDGRHLQQAGKAVFVGRESWFGRHVYSVENTPAS